MRENEALIQQLKLLAEYDRMDTGGSAYSRGLEDALDEILMLRSKIRELEQDIRLLKRKELNR